MAVDELENSLEKIRLTFKEAVGRLEPLAQSLIVPPELFFSRLLLGSIGMGTAVPDERAASACRALEFLDQALSLGALTSPDSGYDEEKLLVTDYLYGQAIDQVVGVGEARIIDILAAAIAGVAEDRVEESCSPYRLRLIVAALGIALLVGEFSAAAAAALSAAAAAAASGSVDWPGALPADGVREFFEQSTSMAANS